MKTASAASVLCGTLAISQLLSTAGKWAHVTQRGAETLSTSMQTSSEVHFGHTMNYGMHLHTFIQKKPRLLHCGIKAARTAVTASSSFEIPAALCGLISL